MFMRIRSCTALFQAVLLLLALLAISPMQARGLPDFTRLVEANSPAVVNISTTRKVENNPMQDFSIPDMPNMPNNEQFREFLRKFFEGHNLEKNAGELPGFDASSLGSGFIISEDGYVVTNYHVIKGAEEIIVRLIDRREFVAEVIGKDKRSDIALLKIEASDLPVVKTGSSKKLKQGEWVFAIGSPFDFDHSVTAGIVSALGRSLPGENYVPFIQTDVAINPGNSGGPLFNMDGEVVGVNSQIYSRTGGFMGLSFSIPVELMLNVVEQIKTKGHVSRGWLGVIIQEVTRELAESFGLPKASGALVAQVLPDSPALKAGVEVGDVILEFNGERITRSSVLPPIVGVTPIGEASKLIVLRNGNKKELTVTIEELPEDEVIAAQQKGKQQLPGKQLGMILETLSDENIEKLGVKNGLLVKQVGEGPARQAGIRPGDVLVAINNIKVTDIKTLEKIIAELSENRPAAVLLHRDGSPVFLALKPGKE